MTTRAEERKAEVVDGIVAGLAQRFPAPELPAAERFVRLFYRDVAPADLEGRDPRDLYGAALALFRFAQERAPGAVRLRAYNPRLEQHGGLTKPDTCAREGGRIKYQLLSTPPRPGAGPGGCQGWLK